MKRNKTNRKKTEKLNKTVKWNKEEHEKSKTRILIK
jgi:hypothetical protein